MDNSFILFCLGLNSSIDLFPFTAGAKKIDFHILGLTKRKLILNPLTKLNAVP